MSAITIDGPPMFQMSVTELLGTIRKNIVGEIIASGIESISGRDLTIVPFDAGKAALYGSCNALAQADNLPDSAPKGITGDLKGESGWYVGKEDNPTTREDERYTRMPSGQKGTGAGSDVHLYFTADAGAGCVRGVGHLADEILFHEMVHALRDMQGKRNPVPTEGNLRGYDNEEEFLAIVVTNVYMSVNNKSQLRGDHGISKVLDSSLATSAGFLSDPDNLRLMSIYKLIWQPTFWFLHTVAKPKFNPFRELTLRLNYLTDSRPFQ